MISIKNKSEFPIVKLQRNSILVICVFLIYFLIGALVFRDYGISTDEVFQNQKADLTIDYILGRNDQLLSYDDRHYGAVLAIIFKLVGSIFDDIGSDFYARHFITFLIFYVSTIIFYKLLRKMGYNQVLSLVGVAILVSHPHIFSHSYYNPKDIPFLSIFIINLYTLYQFIKDRSSKNAMIHGFFSGLLIVFRLPGILMLAITALIGLWVLILDSNNRKKTILMGFVYLIASVATVFIFLPAFWAHPIQEARIYLSMDLFTWGNKELFMGKYLYASELPWHHIPVYIVVTTPLLYILFFGLGNIFIIYDLIHQREILKVQKIHKLIAFITFYFSLGMILIKDPVIYNGWRHVFFLYPAIVLFIVECIDRLWHIQGNLSKGQIIRWIRIIIVVVTTCQLIRVGIFMADSHPYEHVFYNRLAGKNLAEARKNFNMDYWGTSYKEALENLLAIDDSPEIRINGDNYAPLVANLILLDKDSRKRITIVDIEEDADYFITLFRTNLETELPGRVMISSIYVQDAIINATYRYK